MKNKLKKNATKDSSRREKQIHQKIRLDYFNDSELIKAQSEKYSSEK